MRLSFALQSNEKNARNVEFARILLFVFALFISVAISIFQEGFVNWEIIGPTYAILAAAFFSHFIWFGSEEYVYRSPKVLFFGFVLDSLFISLLVLYSGLNQSLYLFLHLINILLGGIACRSLGALSLALITSIFFSFTALLSPDMKAINFFFILALNNIAFFSVAGLAGYLSEQFQEVSHELKKTGLSLRSAQELNQVLIENIPTGMISFSDDGEIIRANAAALQILGRDDFNEMNWKKIFPDFNFNEAYFKGDVKYSDANNDTKILDLKLSRIYSSELQTELNIALFDDLTKIRQLEFAARQNEKLAAVGGLAAGIAHEIRNPLAGISGSIELLSQTAINEDDRKLMRIILREIDRLNALITEFLDYARPEKPPTDVVDLSIVFTEVLDSMLVNQQVRSDVKQVREYSEGLAILGARDKLKQAFLNIILNSYQAMNESQGPTLSLRSTLREKDIEVRIRDNGCGMSEATKRKMFEPFHTTKPKGTGLGLAVTHKILEGHGAQFFVESEVGVGTEIILTFPRAS